MKINLSDYNTEFVNHAKEQLDIDEDTIVNNALIYYRAMKTAREQTGIDINNLKEYGKSDLGLLEGEDLHPYLLTIFNREYMGVRAIDAQLEQVEDAFINKIPELEQKFNMLSATYQRIKTMVDALKSSKDDPNYSTVQQLKSEMTISCN